MVPTKTRAQQLPTTGKTFFEKPINIVILGYESTCKDEDMATSSW